MVSSSPMIKQLRQETRKLEQVQVFINSFLDPELSKRMMVGALGDDFIVLIAESPAWAAKMRYVIPLLLDNFALKDEFKSVKTIRIRTQKHDRPEPPRPVPHRLKIGADAAKVMKDTAGTMEDEAIAMALQRLSNHSEEAS